MKWLATMGMIAMLVAEPAVIQAQTRSCIDDTLRKNSGGKVLITASGMIFETLPGENIEALLWLPISSLLICTQSIEYQGTQYELYEIINVDDGGKVTAQRRR